MRGKLIVFEGVEGCGKTTQLKKLFGWFVASELLSELKQQGRLGGVIATCEPGSTKLGARVRELLLGDSPDTLMHSRAELLLFAADRAQHVEEVIRPNLEQGNIILCDRFEDSTTAYQRYGRGLDGNMVLAANTMAADGVKPDLVFWLDLDPVVGLARAGLTGGMDRMEANGIDFHRRVYEGFKTLLSERRSMVRIAGDRPILEVSREIEAIFEAKIRDWYPP